MSAILAYAGQHRVSIATAAHALDPDGVTFSIRDVVNAIDARNRIPCTCAGDYYDQCSAAALLAPGERGE